MRSYLFRGDQVTIFADTPTSIPDDAVLIESLADLNQTDFPVSRLVSIWNTLPGAEPVKRFRDRPSAVKRLWSALEALPMSSSRSDSKQARLLSLLQRSGGASMDELTAATGWQRHSVRGVLSGVLRKKLGLAVSSTLVDSVRIYRIGA